MSERDTSGWRTYLQPKDQDHNHDHRDRERYGWIQPRRIWALPVTEDHDAVFSSSRQLGHRQASRGHSPCAQAPQQDINSGRLYQQQAPASAADTCVLREVRGMESLIRPDDLGCHFTTGCGQQTCGSCSLCDDIAGWRSAHKICRAQAVIQHLERCPPNQSMQLVSIPSSRPYLSDPIPR